MFLITSASGVTGEAVLGALRARGAAVRAVTRSAEKAARLQALGAAEVMEGDIRDPALLRAAMRGVRGVYHIAPRMSDAELAIGEAAIAAARAEGVGLFAFHSLIFPYLRSLPHHWDKLAVQEALVESGLPYVILQPTMYMQNLLNERARILREDVYALPHSPDTRLGLVDLHDVAEAAAIVLTDPSHAGGTYELASADCLTRHEMCAVLSEELGRPVRAVVRDMAEWREEAGRARTPWQVDRVEIMHRHYGRHGLVGGNPHTLRMILGREPGDFRAFVRRDFAPVPA